jgi:hypothetical protein
MLDVDASSVVSSMAEELATLWSLSPDEIQLVSQGRLLSKAASLTEAGIENGSRLQLSIRASAGGGLCCRRVKIKKINSETDADSDEEDEEKGEVRRKPSAAKQEAMKKHHLRQAITITRQDSRHDFNNHVRPDLQDVDDTQTRLQIYYSKDWAHKAKVAAMHFMQHHQITAEEYEFELHDCHGNIFDPKMKIPKDQTVDEYFPLVFVFHRKPKPTRSRFSLSPRRSKSRSPSPRRSPKKVAPTPWGDFDPARALAERHPSIESALNSFTHLPWLRELRRPASPHGEAEEVSPSKREQKIHNTVHYPRGGA